MCRLSVPSMANAARPGGAGGEFRESFWPQVIPLSVDLYTRISPLVIVTA